MSEFPWGEVLETFSYNFDGKTMEVTKFHPWKYRNSRAITGTPDTKQVQFHCEELRQSTSNLHELVIAWIANESLGLNQYALVAGVARALCLGKV